MLLDVEHRFAFEYDGYISESFMELKLQPKSTADQTVSSFVLSVGPPARVHRYLDWNDNATHHFTITRFDDRIEISSLSLVSTHPTAPPIASLAVPAAVQEGPYPLLDFLAFGGPVPLTPALRAAHEAAAPARSAPLGEHVLALGRYLAEAFEYQKDVTKVDSTTEHFLRIGAGVCQDHAHVFIAACRANGISARYVSGYFYAPDSPMLASHAWADVCVDPARSRWLSVDVTHGCLMDERHVRLAVGPDYAACLPIRGVRHGGGDEAMRVRVDIRPA